MGKRGAHAGGHDGLKRHALGTEEAGLVFELGSNFKLGEAGADEAKNVVEELAAEQGRFMHDGQLFLVLDHAQGLDQGGGQRSEKRAAQMRRKALRAARKLGDGGVGGIKSGKFDAGLRGEPLHGVDCGRAGDDLHAWRRDFFGGLGGVAAIGEEAGSAAGDGKSGAGAGESGEIAEIGKMRDEKPVKSGAGDAAAQLTDRRLWSIRERINQRAGWQR